MKEDNQQTISSKWVQNKTKYIWHSDGDQYRDEFYTKYTDISNELKHYWPQLEGKCVYCNCDDWRKSQFYKYFRDNFHSIGLKQLVTTGYVKDGHGVKCVYDGITESDSLMEGDGSFMSDESLKVFDQCDVVVTNPPFKMMKEFEQLLWPSDKKWLYVCSNTQCVIAPLATGTARFGHNGITVSRVDNTRAMACRWFTNLDVVDKKYFTPDKRLDEVPFYRLDPIEKGSYKGESIIGVDRTKYIPCDYFEKLAVPITSAPLLDPNEWDFLAICYGTVYKKDNPNFKYGAGLPKVNGKIKFMRVIVQQKAANS